MFRALILSAAALASGLAGADAMRAGGVRAGATRVAAARSARPSMGLGFDEKTAMAGDPNAKNYRKLSDALKEADTERRKEEEAGLAAMREADDKRNKRAKKLEVMKAIPDDAPAGKVRRRCERRLLARPARRPARVAVWV